MSLRAVRVGLAEPRRRPAADRGQRPAAAPGHCVWLPGNDDQRDHLLPCLISSKTQLAVDRDPAAERQLHQFLDAGLTEEASRRLLESRFPEELALRYMAGGQLAHARANCEMAQAAFVRDWGAAEAAGGQSRAQLLRGCAPSPRCRSS